MFSNLLIKFPFMEDFISLFFLFVISMVFWVIAKVIVIPVLSKVALKTETTWDDYVINQRIPHKIASLLPFLIFYYGAYFLENYQGQIQKIAFIFIVIHLAIILIGLIKVLNEYYNSFAISKKRPLTGVCEALYIIIIIVASIVSISSILGKSPAVLLSSLGAVAAILTLAFKETILSLVSGILIQINDMFRVGDWISMPKYGVDGDLIELGLHSAKIKNWDKTISTIPTNKLVTDAVKNWRGMTETGGRRIKRSILIDQTSIKFCTEDDLLALKKIELIKLFIENKESEISEFNKNRDRSIVVNGRNLTNIGLFRAYVLSYLQHHSKIRQDMTLLVRQLQPDSEQGLPLQIYCFTADIRWKYYEDIQSDIFDHIYASMNLFNLKPFQRSSSYKSQ